MKQHISPRATRRIAGRRSNLISTIHFKYDEDGYLIRVYWTREA